MVKKYVLLFLGLHLSLNLLGQEITLLTIADFDLKGNVKNCTVLTDYGKELLEFDREGRLTKIVTQYNEEDQDITQFKYDGNKLVEKRLESYKNDKLDLQTSMANFFEYDTISEPEKIIEKIISYDKIFFEAQEFHLDPEGKVIKIITSHEDGVDERTIEYSEYQGEITKSNFVNGVIEKSIRISKKKRKDGKVITLKLTKDFVDGEPTKAVEKRFDKEGELLSEEFFTHDAQQGQFVSTKKRLLKYNSENILEKEVTIRGNATSEKSYIFQFDNNKEKNWVKKIVIPDNFYTTRRIVYYKTDDAITDTMN